MVVETEGWRTTKGPRKKTKQLNLGSGKSVANRGRKRRPLGDS